VIQSLPICEICTRSFNDKKSLNNHLKSTNHGSECPECQKMFNGPTSFKSHYSAVHNANQSSNKPTTKDVKVKFFKCTACMQTFDNQQNLWSHKYNAHSNGIFCFCQKWFSNKTLLEEHIQSRHPYEVYHIMSYNKQMSTACGLSITRRVKYNDYNYIKKNIKPEKSCKKCNRIFVKNFQGKSPFSVYHIKSERNYRSSLCGVREFKRIKYEDYEKIKNNIKLDQRCENCLLVYEKKRDDLEKYKLNDTGYMSIQSDKEPDIEIMVGKSLVTQCNYCNQHFYMSESFCYECKKDMRKE
jgi:hypothetical protein